MYNAQRVSGSVLWTLPEPVLISKMDEGLHVQQPPRFSHFTFATVNISLFHSPDFTWKKVHAICFTKTFIPSPRLPWLDTFKKPIDRSLTA